MESKGLEYLDKLTIGLFHRFSFGRGSGQRRCRTGIDTGEKHGIHAAADNRRPFVTRSKQKGNCTKEKRVDENEVEGPPSQDLLEAAVLIHKWSLNKARTARFNH